MSIENTNNYNNQINLWEISKFIEDWMINLWDLEDKINLIDKEFTYERINSEWKHIFSYIVKKWDNIGTITNKFNDSDTNDEYNEIGRDNFCNVDWIPLTDWDWNLERPLKEKQKIYIKVEKRIQEINIEKLIIKSPRWNTLYKYEKKLISDPKESWRSKKKQIWIIEKRLKETIKDDKGSKIPIKDYTQKKFLDSDLPSIIKEIWPYIVYQESKWNPKIKSSSGAVWLMQLMPTIAEKYDCDDRSDPKDNIDTWVKYLEAIYKKLKSNEDYKKIKAKYTLDDDTFLWLVTINAYNAWDLHMITAFRVILENPNTANKYHKIEPNGFGLFFFVSNEYAYWKLGKKYQSKIEILKGQYYAKQSPNYLYEIIQWYIYDNPNKTLKLKKTTSQDDQKGNRNIKSEDNKTVEISDKIIWETYKVAIKNIFNTIKTTLDSELPLDPNLNTSEEITHYKHYKLQCTMADKFYESYKKNKDAWSLICAKYFYEFALKIALDMSIEPRNYKIPTGWDEELLNRIDYCQKALGIVDDQIEIIGEKDIEFKFSLSWL